MIDCNVSIFHCYISLKTDAKKNERLEKVRLTFFFVPAPTHFHVYILKTQGLGLESKNSSFYMFECNKAKRKRCVRVRETD